MATEGSRFFFSYAREDSEIVLRLARELRKAGGNVWLDQLDIRGVWCRQSLRRLETKTEAIILLPSRSLTRAAQKSSPYGASTP